jgi:hypothetical protein
MSYGKSPDSFTKEVLSARRIKRVPIKTHSTYSGFVGEEVSDGVWEVVPAYYNPKRRETSRLCEINGNTGIITILHAAANGYLSGNRCLYDAFGELTGINLMYNSTRFPLSPSHTVSRSPVVMFAGLKFNPANNEFLNQLPPLLIGRSRNGTKVKRYKSIKRHIEASLKLLGERVQLEYRHVERFPINYTTLGLALLTKTNTHGKYAIIHDPIKDADVINVLAKCDMDNYEAHFTDLLRMVICSTYKHMRFQYQDGMKNAIDIVAGLVSDYFYIRGE